MKIAVLFDGAGLARLGLEEAGHECVGFELDPWKHYLGTMVGSGNCICQDATTVDLKGFQGVWASPPCQSRSQARTQGPVLSQYGGNYLEWCLDLSHFPLWVENVLDSRGQGFRTSTIWNAAQFSEIPLQNRNRAVGGNYRTPETWRRYEKDYSGLCPAILATEHKGSRSDQRRASRWYDRKLTLEECAHHQGFQIPNHWLAVPDCFSEANWHMQLYEAIGNGVPVYMAKAFGLRHA